MSAWGKLQWWGGKKKLKQRYILEADGMELSNEQNEKRNQG